KREFNPEVAKNLELIDGDLLEFLLLNATQELPPLTPAQIAGIEQAIQETKDGKLIPHEEVKVWLESWGTENELPPPQCS
ncbi:MAG: hypothetical protein HQL68_07945, partial [Magnetococcales bacterium]|nr:hypothetical protein [Magnetococcales bacterium]